jgi:hypothetical protein
MFKFTVPPSVFIGNREFVDVLFLEYLSDNQCYYFSGHQSSAVYRCHSRYIDARFYHRSTGYLRRRYYGSYYENIAG